MIETIYLHIGTGKAGSTSIQSFLSANKAALHKLGYLVPEVAGKGRHFNLHHILFDETRAKRYYRQSRAPESLQFGTASAFTDALRAEIEAKAAKHIVMSDEALALGATPDGLRRLADWLRGFARQAVIICYVRRQDLAYLSRFQQSVRTGRRSSFRSEMGPRARARLDYYARLRQWADAFGVSALRIVPFETGSFYRGSLILDFANHLGLADETTLDLSERHALSSMCAEHLEILMRVNCGNRRKRGERIDPAVRTLWHAFDKAGGGTKPALPVGVATAILAQFEDSNRRLAREILGREDGVLFREPIAERHPVLGETLTLEAVNEVLHTFGDYTALDIDHGCALIAAIVRGQRAESQAA